MIEMKRYIYIFFLLATISLPCLAQTPQNTMLLVYSDFRFNLPNEPISAVGSLDRNDHFLTFRYGHEPSKKYVAFSILSNDPIMDWGCELRLFLEDVFSGNIHSNCNKPELEGFTETFVHEKQNGIWKGEGGYIVYYSIGDKDVFLFVVNPAGIVVQIGSDFLKKRGLKSIVSGYID